MSRYFQLLLNTTIVVFESKIMKTLKIIVFFYIYCGAAQLSLPPPFLEKCKAAALGSIVFKLDSCLIVK